MPRKEYTITVVAGISEKRVRLRRWGAGQTKWLQRPLSTFFDPSIYCRVLGKHLIDNVPSVGNFEKLSNMLDARDQQFRHGGPHGMCGQRLNVWNEVGFCCWSCSQKRLKYGTAVSAWKNHFLLVILNMSPPLKTDDSFDDSLSRRDLFFSDRNFLKTIWIFLSVTKKG